MKKIRRNIFIVLIISLFFNTTGFSAVNTAKAATNLINNGSFEGDIHADWGFWQEPGSNRVYDFYRAYDAPFGYGSYCAAIDASGTPAQAFSAILSTSLDRNSFNVDGSKNYYLLFYAKATTEMEIISYFQRADNYAAITNYHARTITDNWQRYMINLSPSVSAETLLAFVIGDMPDNTTLYLDGIQIVEANSELITKKISGYIGESGKFLKINNVSNFSEEEIQIEIPYYDDYNPNINSNIRIRPDRMTNNGIYFTMPERSYAGIGKVFINDIFIGQFDYNALIKINEFHPSVIRLNEDVIVSGSGFSPVASSTFLIVETINSQNKREQVWLSPESFDSNLSQMRFRFPSGIVSGNMFIQSSFINIDGVEILNKSNKLQYKLKPIVTATNWSERGYEHVGNKLKIYGFGFGRRPVVKYYNENDEIIETINAKFIEANDIELIEVATTKKINNFNITVISDGVESDKSSALSYFAKPILSSIKTKHSRILLASDQKISAVKIGEEITLSGLGFRSITDNVNVEFQGYNNRITVPIVPGSNKGASLKVLVPPGTLNGYISVVVNGVESNYIPIEVIPTIISVNPNPIVPGEEIIIEAYGVGSNVDLAKIIFKADSREEKTINPNLIETRGTSSIIYIKAPYDLSYKDTELSLQYDRWKDNGSSVLNIRPHIIRAGINMDNKILSIIGYGFSITPKENNITYKYADANQTIIAPNAKVLGVYPTEEGQEIRIKILDDYYYGHISVQVGEYVSNEVNFGPISISSISRRIEYVQSMNSMMGVLYIKGYNFGSSGGVLVGGTWADVHYRSDFFIIAVVSENNLYDGPVIVARN